jgi:hypothetical protein
VEIITLRDNLEEEIVTLLVRMLMDDLVRIVRPSVRFREKPAKTKSYSPAGPKRFKSNGLIIDVQMVLSTQKQSSVPSCVPSDARNARSEVYVDSTIYIVLVACPVSAKVSVTDRDLDLAQRGGVKSALSCKQGHAHYTATLSLSGWWN